MGGEVPVETVDGDTHGTGRSLRGGFDTWWALFLIIIALLQFAGCFRSDRCDLVLVIENCLKLVLSTA